MNLPRRHQRQLPPIGASKRLNSDRPFEGLAPLWGCHSIIKTLAKSSLVESGGCVEGEGKWRLCLSEVLEHIIYILYCSWVTDTQLPVGSTSAGLPRRMCNTHLLHDCSPSCFSTVHHHDDDVGVNTSTLVTSTMHHDSPEWDGGRTPPAARPTQRFQGTPLPRMQACTIGLHERPPRI